jgi:hypothetical protein
MKFKLFLTCKFIFVFYLESFAQEKYALVIGVDHYAPPANYTPTSTTGRLDFPNLEGCKNDALSIVSIINSKFLFPLKNIDTLFDDAASRTGILKGIDNLMTKCKSGDVAFIYYAGHGSQVKNSSSAEGDGQDESIVPSDTWKENVPDIRDKEIAKICNSFLDKNIRLTMMFDCCHSGSLSRGPIAPGKFRYIASLNYDVKDPSQPTPPETRMEGNFLIFSAAQDNEFAQEQTDENNVAHGAFTLAFIAALNQQSVDASVINLFATTRAILKSNGKKQEPVLAGTLVRQQETLFGLARGVL